MLFNAIWVYIGILVTSAILFLFIRRFTHRTNRGKLIRWATVKRVPRWVYKEANNISRRYGGTSSWALNRVFYVKGRYRIYRLSFLEQGGTKLIVEQKRRRSRK